MRVDDLTCCRALFAAWVFLYHLHLQLGSMGFGVFEALVRRGYLGVDGFFVLSGMVLAHAHPALGLGLREAVAFWLKRLMRIYPVHLATLALLMAVVLGGWAAGLPPRDPGRFAPGELARHLLLVHGWGFSGRWAWNYPSWSVSTELAGYLAFPALWFCVRQVPGRVCAFLPLAMAGLLAAVDFGSGPVGLNLTFQGALARFFPEFVAGMAAPRLAGLLGRNADGSAVAAAGVVGAGLALAAGRDWLVVAGLWLVLAGLLMAARQGRAPALARVPLLRFLGELSYAFYMSFALVETVQAFIWRRADVAPAERAALFAATTTVLTFGLALLLRVLVERPALRLGRSLARRAADG